MSKLGSNRLQAPKSDNAAHIAKPSTTNCSQRKLHTWLFAYQHKVVLHTVEDSRALQQLLKLAGLC